MAYGELIVKDPPLWRCRFKLPNGTWGSKSGFPTKEAAEDWGDEQEDQIRRSVWRDPREGEKPFDVFAEEWFAAVSPRLEPTTVAKYRSYLDNQLLPKWSGWPMVVIYHDYEEIEKWLSQLDENYADSSVSSYFALFSTIMGVASDRAKIIPGNPCRGVRIGSGEYEEERLVASPVQILRAAMRLYERGLGLGGFTLCLLDGYTGARWGELVGQQRHEYDPERRRIRICAPLKEVSGKVFKGGSLAAQSGGATSHPSPVRPGRRRSKGKKGRTKTPAGTRWVDLPPSIAVFYEELMDSHPHPFVLCTPEGKPWRRSNFRNRHWRPVWDGTEGGDRQVAPAILPEFTFHEGRHSHATWLIEDGIPEVARRARLGQKMKGMARVYDHITPEMERAVIQALERRWLASLNALRPTERTKLGEWFPHLRKTRPVGELESAPRTVSISSPLHK
ncbi:tyrosine-type recombinase/integrase [Amycolatopsis albispora]|uniref:tyrosine-type recombinase/integrase n=1 Tax=Amycolatopsis albispora TaxID=1804986 RepID=UPI000DE20435|nr:tyrosine-type recombinase/integrase [Amycolatopsis albispora]